RYEESERTAFHVSNADGEIFGEIVFGPDIYPGRSVVDPNSALSLDAAAAHELTHYHRCRDKSQLLGIDVEDLDEALTTLQAIGRYRRHLKDQDVLQLVSDAIQRIQLHIELDDSCATSV